MAVTGASGRRQWNRATTAVGYGSSSDRTVFFGMGSIPLRHRWRSRGPAAPVKQNGTLPAIVT